MRLYPYYETLSTKFLEPVSIGRDEMSEFYGKEYNYDIWGGPNKSMQENFSSIFHAGEPAPHFTLPLLDGGEVTLSKLRGKPVMIEFGAIT